MKITRIALSFLFCLMALSQAEAAFSQDVTFSRLVIYDVRGVEHEETAIILEQQGQEVKVWLKNYLGERSGEVPVDEYRADFEAMRSIRGFALKREYQGKPLRARAAKGMITLAWKESGGKQIRSIRYYAPEHTLDDFRSAFNSIWGLSRYAILSTRSLESPQLEFLEDAVYFYSGSGWVTYPELQKVVDFHRQNHMEMRVLQDLWKALDRQYPASSEFSHRAYLRYCLKKSMLMFGDDAAHFLENQASMDSEEKLGLKREISAQYQ